MSGATVSRDIRILRPRGDGFRNVVEMVPPRRASTVFRGREVPATARISSAPLSAPQWSASVGQPDRRPPLRRSLAEKCSR